MTGYDVAGMIPALVIHRGAGKHLGVEIVAAEKRLHTVAPNAAIDAALFEVGKHLLKIGGEAVEELGACDLFGCLPP